MNKPSTAIVTALMIIALMGAAPGHTKGGADMIAVGEDFVEFELEAHDGTTVRSAELTGRPFLLFFYPKADTPG